MSYDITKDVGYPNKIQRAVDKSRVKWMMIKSILRERPKGLDCDTRIIKKEIMIRCGFCVEFKIFSLEEPCTNCPVQKTCDDITQRVNESKWDSLTEDEKIGIFEDCAYQALEAINRVENIYLKED